MTQHAPSFAIPEYQNCPRCGTPVTRSGLYTAGGPPYRAGWCEYTETTPRVWTVHSPARCLQTAAMNRTESTTEEPA